MARFLKNTQLKGGSHSIQLPIGTATLGPTAPVDGLTRYNKTNSKLEYFSNNSWHSVAVNGLVPMVIDQFTGDQFDPDTNETTMSQSAADVTDIMVFIGGIYQIPAVNYTVNGNALSLSSAPPTVDAWGNPNKIVVIHNLNSTNATADTLP